MNILNTVGAPVMVDPSIVPGEHSLFLCGDDGEAKEQAIALLASFGWAGERILDLGGIDASRGMEMYLPLWVRLYGRHGSTLLNVHVLHG